MTTPPPPQKTASIAEIDAMLPNSLSSEEAELLTICSMIKYSQINHLNSIFTNHPDKRSLQDKIDSCIKQIKGEGYSLTGHGISQTLSARYSETKLKKIGHILKDITKGIKDNLLIDCFVTSGTLLGLVREGKIISYDDDFDLAYVSLTTTRDELLEERRRLYLYLKTLPNMQIKNQGKHFTIAYGDSKLEFGFDLFPSWVENDTFNEVPLKPSTLSASKVLPLSRINFYGIDLNAPNDPEALLELNYGPNWRVPDPSFRFDFAEYADFYWFIHKDHQHGDYND